MKLIAGLGNPGKQYEKTRHNIGFMVLEKFRNSSGLPDFKEEPKFNASVSMGEIGGEKIILAQPLAFMNLSGDVIQKIVHYYKLDPADCIVVCDDLDTPFGRIRIRKNGGPGTHNGLKSMSSCIGNEYVRVRIGIENRNPDIPRQDVSAYVLDKFSKTESKDLPEIIDKASAALTSIINDGIDAAMNKYN